MQVLSVGDAAGELQPRTDRSAGDTEDSLTQVNQGAGAAMACGIRDLL